MYVECVKVVYLLYQLTTNTKTMEKLNYSKLVIANDDLELVIKSLELLEKTTKCEHTKGEANRIIWKLSAVLNPEVYNYKENALMFN